MIPIKTFRIRIAIPAAPYELIVDNYDSLRSVSIPLPPTVPNKTRNHGTGDVVTRSPDLGPSRPESGQVILEQVYGAIQLMNLDSLRDPTRIYEILRSSRV